jgi:GNAT superfamily N-acetyltransferase
VGGATGARRRYARPTHRPHADIEKVAVAASCQGRGIGRLLMAELVSAARLYQSLGFAEYGRLAGFVAVGPARYDKIFYARDLRATASPEPTS